MEKEKKPPTEAQLAKQKREKNAAARIQTLTGVSVPPTQGARLLKLEREGKNTKEFLNSIRLKSSLPKTAKVKAPKAPNAPKANEDPIANNTPKPAIKTLRKKKNTSSAAAATAPVSAPNANLGLTNDDLKILQKCERVHEKILQKAKLNLKNALGRNANASNAKALANIRKSGATLSAQNYLKVASARKQQTMTRRGRPPMTLENVAPKKTAAVKKTLEEFLEKNA